MDVPFEEVISASVRKKRKKKERERQLSNDNYYEVLSRMHVDDDNISIPDSQSDDSASRQNSSKKAKKSALNFSAPDPEAKHVIVKCLDDQNPMAFNKIDSFTRSDFFEELIGSYSLLKPLSNGSLLVVCDTASQATQLLDINNMAGVPACAEIACHIGTVRGVIEDASICDKSDEEVLERLKSQKVVSVRPIYKGEGIHKVRTKFTILSFRLGKLPRTVKFGREEHKLTPYRIKVVQCKKCWWFGHHTDKCQRGPICKACCKRGEGHDNEACLSDTGTQIKCSNCFGRHPADDKNCPVWVKQLAIGKIRCNHQVGYHKAMEILKRKNRNSDNNKWDGTDVVALGGNRGRTAHGSAARGGTAHGSAAGAAAAGPSGGAASGPPRSSNNNRAGLLSVSIPQPVNPLISVDDRTPNYSGAVKSPPPGSRRNPVIPIKSQDNIAIGTVHAAHGPVHTISPVSGDSEMEEEVLSQVLPRRTYSGRTLRPIPHIALSTSLYSPRQPGSLSEVGEASKVPARRPLMRDAETQIATFANKSVQTDTKFLELEAVISILREIPTMLTFEDNKFQFSESKLLTVLNKSLGLHINPQYIQDASSG